MRPNLLMIALFSGYKMDSENLDLNKMISKFTGNFLPMNTDFYSVVMMRNWTLDDNANVMIECFKEGSNEPFYRHTNVIKDLKSQAQKNNIVYISHFKDLVFEEYGNYIFKFSFNGMTYDENQLMVTVEKKGVQQSSEGEIIKGLIKKHFKK